jgi:hypothetical protein
MLVKLAKQQLRQYNVSNLIASARIEGISLSKQFQKNLADYVWGKKSIVQLIKETKSDTANSNNKVNVPNQGIGNLQ